jgi:hypothetical protein
MVLSAGSVAVLALDRADGLACRNRSARAMTARVSPGSVAASTTTLGVRRVTARRHQLGKPAIVTTPMQATSKKFGRSGRAHNRAVDPSAATSMVVRRKRYLKIPP